MKKILLLLTILIYPLLSYGQFSLGVSAGANVSKMSISLRDLSTFRISPTLGYNANLIVEYNLNPNLSLLSGLSISQKGFNHNISIRYSPNFDSAAIMSSKLEYLELPVYLKFNSKINKLNVFYGFGPYFAYGIHGKITTTISGRSETTVTDIINWNKPKDYLKSELVKEYGYNDIKRSEVGIAALFGIKYQNFIISTSYKYGLNNIMWEYYQDERMSNSTLSFSVGYYFLSPKIKNDKKRLSSK